MANPERSGRVRVYPDPSTATRAAADWFVEQISDPSTKNVMLAGGNTPLGLYAEVARRQPNVAHVTAFALDEYVGVPLDEPRNCANLIRSRAIEPWGIPQARYRSTSSLEDQAQASIREHEQSITAAGGLDLVVLGLGRNGHIGFNEPGSDASSVGRIVELDQVSIDANREWFAGDYAPYLGVTTGMKLILAAKQILILAFGIAKARPVVDMLEGPTSSECPASLLNLNSGTIYILDAAAASQLTPSPSTSFS